MAEPSSGMSRTKPPRGGRRRVRDGIDRLPSGHWRARLGLEDGSRSSATFNTKVEADAWLAAQRTDQSRGAWVDPRRGELTFGGWVEAWWSTTTNLRPSTRARDRGYIDRYLLPVFQAYTVGSISQLEVRGWVAGLTDDGLAPATVVKAYQILAKIMGAAVDGGLIATTPCRRVPLPRVERHEMRFLTTDEVARLADAIHPRYRALVLLGAYGGLRIGELAGLRRDRVDILRRRVEVAEILVEVAGRISTGPPKTRAGRRNIALPRFVLTELNDHLANWSSEDHVFTAPQGGPLRVPAWRRRFWNPAVAEAQLEPLRPHDLRHTAVALWIAQGASPKHIAARAGHTSVAFTLDRYGHLYPDAEDTLMDRLDSAAKWPAEVPSLAARD